jgi:hypothetical protein
VTVFAPPFGHRMLEGDKVLEWPRGSGRRAIYTPDEQRLMLNLTELGCGADEVALIHDLKVEFSGTLIDTAAPTD